MFALCPSLDQLRPIQFFQGRWVETNKHTCKSCHHYPDIRFIAKATWMGRKKIEPKMANIRPIIKNKLLPEMNYLEFIRSRINSHNPRDFLSFLLKNKNKMQWQMWPTMFKALLKLFIVNVDFSILVLHYFSRKNMDLVF